MTWVQMVQDEAKKRGIELSDDEAGYILWNETGYPSFYTGDAQTYFRRQVSDWCERVCNAKR